MLELFEVGFDIILHWTQNTEILGIHVRPPKVATSGWILWASPQRRQWCWWEDAQSNHRRRPPSVAHSHGCQIYLDLFIFSRLLFWLPISIIDHRTCLFEWHTRAPVILAFSLLLLSVSYLCKQPLELWGLISNLQFFAHRSGLHRCSEPALPPPGEPFLSFTTIFLLLLLVRLLPVKHLGCAALELVPIEPAQHWEYLRFVEIVVSILLRFPTWGMLQCNIVTWSHLMLRHLTWTETGKPCRWRWGKVET